MRRSRLQKLVRRFPENGMKLLLENPDNVKELLAFTDTGLIDLIDFDRMTLVRTTFVARDYRHVEADVVLTAPLRSPPGERSRRRVWIYVLLEHQSEPDTVMPLRVLDYVVQLYKAQLRAWSRRHGSFANFRLQPVLPVVFYTGTRSWDAVGSLQGLMVLGERFANVTPALQPLYLNLGSVPAARLESAGSFFGWVLRLIQGRKDRPEEFQTLLERVLAHLEGMRRVDRLRWLELLSYLQFLVYHEREPREQPALQDIIVDSVGTDELRREVAAMGKSMAEVLMDRGRKEGRKVGRKEGKEEGRKEAEVRNRQQILLLLLRERFGELPAVTAAAVEAARDVEQLERWLKRVVTAKTLDTLAITGNRCAVCRDGRGANTVDSLGELSFDGR